MDRKHVISALAALGFPVAANISSTKLEAIAVEKGVPLDPPEGGSAGSTVVTTLKSMEGTPGPGTQLGGGLPPLKQIPQGDPLLPSEIMLPPDNDNDIAWRVSAGLPYEEAVRASRRQAEVDAEIAAANAAKQ